MYGAGLDADHPVGERETKGKEGNTGIYIIPRASKTRNTDGGG
jgi:hypothetical protein